MIRMLAPVSAPSSVGHVARELLAHARAAGLDVRTAGPFDSPDVSATWYHGAMPSRGALPVCPDVLGYQTDDPDAPDGLNDPEFTSGVRFLYVPSKWVFATARHRGYVGEAAVVPHGISDCFRPTVAEAPTPFRYLLVAAGGDAWQPGVEGLDKERQHRYLKRKGLDAVARAWMQADIGGALLSVVTHLGTATIAMLREHGFAGDLSIVAPPAFDSQWPKVYQSAHAVIVPSRREAFGLPAMQAIACGVPLAMTRDRIGAADVLPPDCHALVAQHPDGSADIDSLVSAITALRHANLVWRDRARDASPLLRETLAWGRVAEPVVAALRRCESC